MNEILVLSYGLQTDAYNHPRACLEVFFDPGRATARARELKGQNPPESIPSGYQFVLTLMAVPEGADIIRDGVDMQPIELSGGREIPIE